MMASPPIDPVLEALREADAFKRKARIDELKRMVGQKWPKGKTFIGAVDPEEGRYYYLNISGCVTSAPCGPRPPILPLEEKGTFL